MAGEAKTSAFMLGAATVMIGTPDKLFDLNPVDHSIGLVKNFRVTGEPSYTDLTQGVKNQVVYSVMTGNVVRASMEAFEYTGRNISYSLGLEGGTVVAQTVATALSAPASVSDVTVTVTSETGFAVDDYVMIQDGTDDKVYVRKLTAVTVGVLTFAQALPKAIASGATVKLSNVIGIGSKTEQPYLAAKIVGTLADKTEVVVLCPKIRITNGFSLGFTTEGFDNLPYEFSFYDQIASDPFYSEFSGEQAKLLTTK
jgi:hypothetical protein